MRLYAGPMTTTPPPSKNSIRHTYNPAHIEPKWQRVWDEKRAFATPTDIEVLRQKPKYYILDMFPYPSGAGLHVGHPEGYTATDIVARLKRMQGFHVLHPMGWDAFGLPAERAAMRDNEHPAVITKRNVDNFRGQIKRLGFSYDWDREIDTSSVEYYRWTQWIFLKLYEKNLAYLAEVPVNWCPALGTVLANEEVKDGRYVETGDIVERRTMRQWMLRITAYAERLLEDLDGLDWPESVKDMQRNWIGKSIGAEITFKIADSAHSFVAYTTRPDTLFGATYCVLAPEHALVSSITTKEQREAVENYVATARNKTDLARTDLAQDKTGVFTGAYAINPVNNERIPVWIADYVLMSYGTGAIMAVPAHDERDHAFAKKFVLPIIQVIGHDAEMSKAQKPIDVQAAAYADDGVAVNSGFLNGLHVEDAKQRMVDWLQEQGIGKGKVQYRLRDWLFSRQRYWGEPFPVVHADDGEIIPLAAELLPVELPPIDAYRPTADGRPPLARADENWLRVQLPDGRTATRETNTMPQWAGSCWYYLRYIDPKNTQAAWSSELENYWMPVDLYIGGVEHAVLHLLYSRFWHKVLFDCGLVSTKEPFQKLFNQGMILAYSYKDDAGKYYYPGDVVEKDNKYYFGEQKIPLKTQIEKMSKSRFNVVNPDDVIKLYGADAVRLYEMFMGPLEQVKPWQMAGVEGVSRFLARAWRLVVDEETGEVSGKIFDENQMGSAYDAIEREKDIALWRGVHRTVKKVEEDTLGLRFNTAISQMMTFLNETTSVERMPRGVVELFLHALSPYAPHLAEELWARLGHEVLLCQSSWPKYDPALCEDATITVAVQVNGKRRDELSVPRDMSEDDLKQLALTSERVTKFFDGKTPKKVIVVKGRLINIVV